jgi:hypothetical protein
MLQPDTEFLFDQAGVLESSMEKLYFNKKHYFNKVGFILFDCILKYDKHCQTSHSEKIYDFEHYGEDGRD